MTLLFKRLNCNHSLGFFKEISQKLQTKCKSTHNPKRRHSGRVHLYLIFAVLFTVFYKAVNDKLEKRNYSFPRGAVYQKNYRCTETLSCRFSHVYELEYQALTSPPGASSSPVCCSRTL